MKNWIYKIFAATITASMLWGCEPTIDVPAPSSGDADFTNYVAVGNSLTAGYADNGLYADAQMQSYPAMIAGQINKISPITFSHSPTYRAMAQGIFTLLHSLPPLVKLKRTTGGSTN
jgi:hypothetical protein